MSRARKRRIQPNPDLRDPHSGLPHFRILPGPWNLRRFLFQATEGRARSKNHENWRGHDHQRRGRRSVAAGPRGRHRREPAVRRVTAYC